MITFVIGFILGSCFMMAVLVCIFFVWDGHGQEPEPMWEDAPVSEIPPSAEVGESAHF